jgi:hypothetical protein
LKKEKQKLSFWVAFPSFLRLGPAAWPARSLAPVRPSNTAQPSNAARSLSLTDTTVPLVIFLPLSLVLLPYPAMPARRPADGRVHDDEA